MTNKKRRLGRGLEALLGGSIDVPEDDPRFDLDDEAPLSEEAPDVLPQPASQSKPAPPPKAEAPAPKRVEPAALTIDHQTFIQPTAGGTVRIPLAEIDENPFQPRRDFSEPEIASLAESLKEHDLLQPVLVRKRGSRYQLISGERRLRAAKQVGWTTIPAQVRDADDRLVAELAIVENLQRKDLNAIEKALSFQRYIQEHACTQEDLAGRLKINRATIANLIRLLELPEKVQDALRDGRVSAGHARALLPLGEEKAQINFAKRIEQEDLSVREVERQVQELIHAEDGGPAIAGNAAARKKRTRAEHVASLEQDLKRSLGTKVEIRDNGKGRGKFMVHFKTHEEFERIFEQLAGGEIQRKAG